MKFVISSLLLAALAVGSYARDYSGWYLVSVSPATEGEVEIVRSIISGNASSEVQVWKEGSEQRPFDIIVSNAYIYLFMASLYDNGIKHQIKVTDVQRAIEAEKRPASTKSRAFRGIANADKFNRYLKIDEVYAFIKQLAKDYPNIVSLQTIGNTHLGKPIMLVKLGTNSNTPKPGIWIDGGIHAREWISPATVLFTLNKLASGYSSDPSIKKLVDGANYYIVPVLNADGYEFTHGSDRMWRKNRRPKSGSSKCEGVDLNRNFDYGFGGAGTSTNTCDETYRGTAAFSEPESQAVRNFVMQRTNELKAFITIHAYSQMWFYPYGDKRGSYPADVKELASLAQKGADALRAVYGTEYEVGTPADLLYPAAGGSDDWAKGTAKIKYVYCLELRPGGDSPNNGFILPPNQILPTGEETYAGLKVVFEEIVRQGIRRSQG